MENTRGSLKKLKIRVAYDSAIPLLSMYPEKALIQKDAWTPKFRATLVTIAKACVCVCVRVA